MKRLALLVMTSLAAVACSSGSDVDPASITIVAADQFSIDEVQGQTTFVATALIDSEDGHFTVEITRDGEFTQSRITSDNEAAPNSTLVSRGVETYALVDEGWVQIDEFGAAGLVLLLAAPDIALQMASEIRAAGAFVEWDEWQGQRVARFDVATIPRTVRAEFYTATGGTGSVWLTEDGIPLRWTAANPDGATGSLEWHLSALGGPVDLDLPPQLGG